MNTASTLSRPIIPVVVLQHAEDSAMLRHVRTGLVRAPHVSLRDLRRLDDRIAAHLDGLAVAGAAGRGYCTAALEKPGAGQAFAAAAAAIDARDGAQLARVFALAAAVPDARRGLLSAIAWWPAETMQTQLVALLRSADAGQRALAIDALRLHGVDPGRVLATLLDDTHAPVRAAAARMAGELGRVDLADALVEAMADDDAATAFHAARAACLLGRRRTVLERLWQEQAGTQPGSDAALALLVLAAESGQAREIVRAIAALSPPEQPSRRLVRATGWLGDSAFVPWLIGLMADLRFARLAGESFSMITGADLAAPDLEGKAPAEIPAGPNDDPEDDDVALDEDESLPWPDAAKVQAWWDANAARCPPGVRHLLGVPVSEAQALHVLKTGCQRQRAAAALWRCLLCPGTPLFNVAAPAWRQQQALDALT